jgi:L-asparaginase / beta-aspartyl-peptidase
MQNITIAIHGGAGTILPASMTEEKEAAFVAALQDALNTGYSILEKGGTALDAVEQTVIVLENNALFNAGKGSVYNAAGKQEMDAAVMDGKNRMAGAVAGINKIKNPVQLARMVMEKTPHVLLTGEGALEFAESIGIPFVDDAYFYDEYRYRQWLKLKNTGAVNLDHTNESDKKFGTVGAVALDGFGNLAAATSTGGMTNKRVGRVGDSPLIGAGTYANNATCAVSGTGNGEAFIRGVVAYDISCLMEYKGLSLQEACNEVIMHRLHRINGEGGVIAADALGNIEMVFNTAGMYRGCKTNGGRNEIGIYGTEV